jgi:hypothetical protein
MNRVTRLGIVALLSFSACVASVGAYAQAPAFLGTWVLNTAKSKGAAGAVPDSITVVISDAGGGQYKSLSDSAMAGVTVRSEVTFAVDGKDYTPVISPAMPGAPPLTQSAEQVSDKVYKTSLKMGGQVIATTLNEISADGKVLTLTTTGVGQFAGASNTMVFDKK